VNNRFLESNFARRTYKMDDAGTDRGATLESGATPWQRSWTPPQCQCFPLCTAGHVLSLYRRLPMGVTNSSSPWYGYLTKVYGKGEVPLPFDLRKLQLFFPGLLPTSTHLCRARVISGLPVVGNLTDGEPLLPTCPQTDCSGWVRTAEEADADPLVQRLHPRGWARGSSHIWTPITQRWMGGEQEQRDQHDPRWSRIDQSRLQLSGRHLFVALQMRSRQFFEDNTLVEVIRIGMGSRKFSEGGNYGCWFYPARGSGIFVNVGNSLRTRSKLEAAAQLGTPPHDEFLPNATRARGFDSLQILHGGPQYGGSNFRYHESTMPTFELVLTFPGCVTLGSWKKWTNLTGPCVPVATRSGWNASRPCHCDPAASPLLNCLSTSATGAVF